MLIVYYSDGHMVPMGIGMVSVPSLLWPLISGGITEWSRPPLPHHIEDETIYDFFARRFNARVADTIADALVTGTLSLCTFVSFMQP
jgi:protoporphyrinogen oxidase